ncbi:unnamed protein product, partial [Closterium sp. NIES-54]
MSCHKVLLRFPLTWKLPLSNRHTFEVPRKSSPVSRHLKSRLTWKLPLSNRAPYPTSHAALPCPACRPALLAARCPALHIAPPSLPRAALPCVLRRLAGCAPPCPCPRAALLAVRCPALPTHTSAACRAALPCPRAPLLAARRPALPAHSPAACRATLLATRRPALPARRPGGCRAILPCPRAALLAVAPPCPARAPPCWPQRRPDLPTCTSLVPARRPARHAVLLPAVVPPPPLSRPMLLLLLLASLVLRRLGLLLLLVGSAASVRAREARVVEVAIGGVVVEAVEAVEVAEVAMGVVVGVGASVAAVVAAVGVVAAVVAVVGVVVALVAAVGVVAAVVVAVGVELFRGEVLAVARGSTSNVRARPLRPSSFTCGKFHTQHQCFSRLDVAWRAEFGDEVECPRWLELLRSGDDIFALDYDAILAAMYALIVSAEGDCYLCVPPDPSIEAAALGASETALPGTVPAEALHTFTLDSGASRCFFRDGTTLTPLPAPILVRLANPSWGPVLARSDWLTPPVFGGSVRLTLRSSPPLVLYDLCEYRCPPGCDGHYHHSWGSACVDLNVYTEGPSLGHVAPPCSCRLLSHHTILWHHRLSHPSLPRLHGMHSRLLVSGLPRSLPPLPPSPAPPCLPCVEGRQRAAPHSSSFPPMTPPLQSLHID